MPENTATERRTIDPKEALIVDMVKSMVVLGKNVEILGQKVEDMIAALDDHRAVTEELNDSVADLSSAIDMALHIVDEVSSISKREDREPKWTDVQEAISKIKSEAEDIDEEDEEDK